MLGKVNESSRRTMKTLLTDIAKQDVQVVILACTELVMLVDTDADVLPIYDPTRVTVAAGVDWHLGKEHYSHLYTVRIERSRAPPACSRPTVLSTSTDAQGI